VYLSRGELGIVIFHSSSSLTIIVTILASEWHRSKRCMVGNAELRYVGMSP